MKNLTLFIIILTSLAYSTAIAQPDTLWTKTFGESGSDKGRSVQQTSDGGYIIVGWTNSYGAGGTDAYLIKTDANGNEQWYQTFGGSGVDQGYCVQQTLDGGYIIAGTSLIKTDANGNESWTQTLGEAEAGNCVQQTSDGGYIIAGTIYCGTGNDDVYLLKTDANGNEQWSRTFGGDNNDDGWSVQQTTDGGYIIAGRTESFPPYFDVYLIKTDTNGNEQWTQTFGESSDAMGFSVQQTSDGGYIIAGDTFGTGNDGVYLIKTDANGNESWSQIFGGSFGRSVQQTSDGGYVIVGNGGVGVYLIKTDTNGNESWSQTFGGSGVDQGYCVQQTSDGGYIIAGETNSYGAGSYDVYLIRLDAEGALVEDFGKNQPLTFSLHPPYPNPFNDTACLEMQIPVSGNLRLSVYDITGGEVERLIEGRFTSGRHKVSWDAEGMSSGVYFVRLEAGNFVQTRKILLIK